MIYKELLKHPSIYSLYKDFRTTALAERIKKIIGAHITKSLTPPLPKTVVMDSSSVCNLACPLCPTGARTIKLKKTILTPDDFLVYIRKFPKLTSVSLYNWGEPFLNPKIFDILEIAARHNIDTDIDTNFSLHLNDDYLLNIIHSGLSVLRVSLDGASQECYSTYRCYGNFDLVFSNIKRLRQLQKQTCSSTPIIYWKFLVNKHNEHELEKAKHLAKEIDVKLIFDQFQLGEDIPDVKVTPNQTLAQKKKFWLTSKKQYLSPYYRSPKSRPPYLHRACPWLFSSLVVHPDGNVLPCCYAASETSSMGNIKNQSIEEIWYSPKYQYARSLFSKGANVKRVPVICEQCPIYQHTNYKLKQ